MPAKVNYVAGLSCGRNQSVTRGLEYDATLASRGQSVERELAVRLTTAVQGATASSVGE